MFEGHDTIFQEQIVEEMGLVLGNAPQKPTYKDMQEMKYLKRVVKEVLRQYPNVYFISRKLGDDVEVHACTSTISTTILTFIQILFDPDRLRRT
jgi:cytochrome P450